MNRDKEDAEDRSRKPGIPLPAKRRERAGWGSALVSHRLSVRTRNAKTLSPGPTQGDKGTKNSPGF